MTDEGFEELTERLRESVSRLEEGSETAAASETTDESDEGSLGKVLDEGEDVLEEFDLEEFLDTVDVEKLPEVVDVSEIPDAIENDNYRKALNLKALMEAIDFREYWDSEKMQGLWKEAKELSDAVGDATGSDGDEGGGLTDTSVTDAAGGGAEMASEAYEGKLQSELADNVEQFRDKIEEARDRLREEIEGSALGGDTDRQPSSDNPTAYSTMPEERPDMEVGTGYSTMPEDRPDMNVSTEYSTMPGNE